MCLAAAFIPNRTPAARPPFHKRGALVFNICQPISTQLQSAGDELAEHTREPFSLSMWWVGAIERVLLHVSVCEVNGNVC